MWRLSWRILTAIAAVNRFFLRRFTLAGRVVLVAAGAAWFYMAVTIVLWLVSCAAAMMTNGGRWAEAAALTEVAIILIPILVIGVSSLLNCRAARREAIVGTTPLSQAGSAAFRAAAVGVIWAAGFFILARLWAGLLLGVTSSEFAVVMRQIAVVPCNRYARDSVRSPNHLQAKRCPLWVKNLHQRPVIFQQRMNTPGAKQKQGSI